MLRVRIDSHDAEVTPIALAQMVLDGRIGRHDLAKSADGATERPLEDSLEPSHFEALSGELLVRLRSMYVSDGRTDDLGDLRQHVEALCQWHWGVPDVQARFLWVAAWLNELTDRLDAAVHFYDAFLQVRCHERHLRLLAYNNRGALRLRLGRLEGVADLVRSALPGESGPTRARRSGGLPAACFNLLNLINVAVRVESLTEVVDEALADCFVRQPEDLRQLWLGSESTDGSGGPGPSSEVLSAAGAEAWAEQTILRDSSPSRLNRLTSNLAAEAIKLAPNAAPSSGEGGCRLALWTDRAESSAVAEDAKGDEPDGRSESEFSRYAEAASLLLADEIPSSLVRRQSPGSQAEQLALEELAEIENVAASGNHELARTRLEVQRRILTALNQRGHCAGLLERVEAQLRWIARSEKELEQLELQRLCGKLISDVEQFCQLVSLSRAERKIGPIRQELGRYRDHVSSQMSSEVMALLDELARRAERHLDRLRRLDVKQRVREPFRALRRHWPDDWAVPVPEVAYAALAECHVHDPEGRIHDWVVLKDQLDAHQAQHHLRGALAQLSGRRASWTAIEAILVDALSLSPDLWTTVSPLFGLFDAQEPSGTPEARPEIRTALESAAGRLLDTPSAGLEHGRVDLSPGLFQQANTLLDRAFRRLHGEARRFLRLWCCLEKTLLPVVVDGTAESIAQVETIAETALEYWPATGKTLPGRNDPRNPVRIFLESCDRATSLAEAERLLNGAPASPPQAKERLLRVLGLGLETTDQLRRIATGLYLVAYGQEDTLAVQRQVLDRLDAWVDGTVINGEERITEETINEALVVLRADAMVDRPPGGAEAPASGEPEPPKA